MKFINKKEICIQSEFLGLVDYLKAYDHQLVRHEQVKNKPDLIWLIGLEHSAVITLGRRAEPEQNLKIRDLSQFQIVKSTRGGLATVHAPGQLVIYPVANIRAMDLGVKNFVKILLKTTQETLLYYGLHTRTDEEFTGLYTKQGKICFCGLQIKEGVSLHGISINISNDLNDFKSIIACGIPEQSFDKLAHYSSEVVKSDCFIQEFFDNWTAQLQKQLSATVRPNNN